MHYKLLQRRHRTSDKGIEVFLIRIYDPSNPSVTLLAVTNCPTGDIVYGGVSYTSYNLHWDSENYGTDTGLPVVVLTISNVMQSIQPAIYNSDFYRGCECSFIIYNTEEPAIDYSTEEKKFLIINHSSNVQDLSFFLSAPQIITELVPPDIFIPYSCRHQFPNWSNNFIGARCGYTGVPISSVVLSGTSPIQINATNHRLVTGEFAFVRNVEGITPSINGVYVVTRVDDNAITLDGTNSSSYSGTGSGGWVGYNECPRHKAACRVRGMISRFGAAPNLRTDGLSIRTT